MLMPTKRDGGVVPFLKWAGGKRWLMRAHASAFDLTGVTRYVEPFVGSGAVFFGLAPDRALLNDANFELIETYRAIKENWQDVSRALVIHQAKHDEEYYYLVRASRPRSLHARAARFIYLNRTCFNGLFRVNQLGQFNVPKGTKSSVLLDTDDFYSVSKLLKHVELVSGDFAVIVDNCGLGDFIFADPPYTVKHNTNGFIKYNERLFSWSDQERLKLALSRAVTRGARVVVSNADHPSIRDLYSDASCTIAERHSVMASESWRRKKTTELLIHM